MAAAQKEREILAWIRRLVPSNIDSLADITVQDFGQIAIHFAPRLAKSVNLDPDATNEELTRTAESVLSELQLMHNPLKHARVNAASLMSKEAKPKAALCEALFKLSEKNPFPRSYDAKAERAKLTTRKVWSFTPKMAGVKRTAAGKAVTSGSMSLPVDYHTCEGCIQKYEQLSSANLELHLVMVRAMEEFLVCSRRHVDPSTTCVIVGRILGATDNDLFRIQDFSKIDVES